MRAPAKHSWNQRFPDNVGDLTRFCDELGHRGMDVHTVTISIYDGSWRVTVDATDRDLQPAQWVGEMYSGGGVQLKRVSLR